MKKLLPLLFLSVLFYGCKKDSLSNNKYLISSENITHYYTGDSTLNEQVNMQYDNQNRLISVTRNWGIKYYVEYDTYTYDQDNNITELTLTDGPNTNTYNYNYTNGVPVSTQYTEQGISGTVYYTVKNNRIIGTQFQNDSQTITYNGNNYAEFIYTDGGEDLYTYGTHKSPFLYTGFKYCLYGLDYVINDNEILGIEALDNGSQVNVEKNTYTYNPQGYPEKEEVYNNGQLTDQIIFSYKQF